MLIGWLEASLLVRWLLGWILALNLPILPASRPPRQQKVSVLIPARNESATLLHLLTALRNQSLKPHEVIVIDDHSVDGTADIVRRATDILPIQLVQSPPLPEGWCGKTWALHHGVQASHCDVLVFLDADTEPGPHFLQRLIAQQEQRGGLLSVQPYHRTEKFYEELSLLFNLVGLMAVPMGPKCGVAFGPAMATSRSDYDQAGGHDGVADKVVEDWFLAHRYEQVGLPVSAWLGGDSIAYRMYPGGLADLVAGFNKNFAIAAGEVRWPWMVAVLLWLSGLFWAAWCLPAAIFGWPMVGVHAIGPNVLLYGAFALQLLLVSRRVGRFFWINLFFPIPVLFFLGVFVLAIINLERGQVVWKGRRVKTR